MQGFEPPSPSDAGYRGIYINLDRATERRRRMERQLAALGWSDRYRRLPAVDGRTLSRVGRNNSGIIGCFRSHAAAVALATEENVPVHIAEDDIVLSPYVGPFIRYATARGLFEHFDIVFLDMWVDPSLPLIDLYLRAFSAGGVDKPPDYSRFSIIDLRPLRIGTAASYVLAPGRTRGLHEALQAELARGPTMPVDHCLSKLNKEGAISAAVVAPFLTSMDLEIGSVSDIATLNPDDLHLFLLLRNAFFIGRDLERVVIPGLDRYRKTKRYPGLDQIRNLIAESAGIPTA